VKKIVVNDGPGFYTRRILAPYVNEAAFLFNEGAAVEDIDRALVEFGFPVGRCSSSTRWGSTSDESRATSCTRRSAPG